MKVLDQQEKFKMAVHLGLFGFTAACALFNVGAWCETGENKHRCSAAIYTSLLLFETVVIMNHARNLHND